MRQMIAEGRYKEAQQFFEGKITERYDYRGPDSFHPAFDTTIDMPIVGKITDERRSVNFETGEVSVTWKQEDVIYERRVFVSRKNDVVVISIRASKPGMINCQVGLLPTGLKRCELGDGKNVRVPRFPMGLHKPKIRLKEVPITFNLSAEKNSLTLLAKYDIGGSYQMVGGDEYGGCARVVADGGNVETSKLQVNVKHADEVLVLIKLFANEESKAAVKRIRSELEQLDADYNVLLKRHVELHREIFLFSEPGMIKLLPALPIAWPVGHVKGLRARGGFEVEIDWKDGKLTRTIIHSLFGNTCKICYGNKMFELKIKAGESCPLNGRLEPF